MGLHYCKICGEYCSMGVYITDKDANDFCLMHGQLLFEKLEAEVERLREELRWRKWPDEKPPTKGKYLVATDGSTDIWEHVSYYSQSIGWATKDAGIAWWRPIGELPKEKTEAGGAGDGN